MKDQTPAKVYVFRIGSLGDGVAALPAIALIKHGYPEADIVVVSEDLREGTIWDSLVQTGWIKEVLRYNGRNLLSILAFVKKIRPDAGSSSLFYLAPYRTKTQRFRDWIYFYIFCGLRNVFGFNSGAPTVGFKDKSGALAEAQSEYLRLYSIVQANVPKGTSVLFPERFLFPGAVSRKKAQDLLSGIPEDVPIVALAPGSKMPAKRWAVENYRVLLSKIHKVKSDVFFVLVGDANDFKLGEALRSAAPDKVRNLCGKTGILDMAAVFERSKVYLGNDSGPMHVAAAVGLPVVAIFSSRDNPGKWEPPGKGNVYIRKDKECSGCMLVECPTMKCINSISVDEVLGAVIPLLDKK